MPTTRETVTLLLLLVATAIPANIAHPPKQHHVPYYFARGGGDGDTHASKDDKDSSSSPPFQKLMAANRGEIATRIFRAATELGIPTTVGIYSHPDRFTQHRYKCDQSFELDWHSKSPVAQYLDIDYIVKLCVANGVEAVHPGYGFLSENEKFAQALEDAGIVFVGPTVENLNTFGDKTRARLMAIQSKVPVVPGGSTETFNTAQLMADWIDNPANHCSYPVMIKALNGGGGRGIRVARDRKELDAKFSEAYNEAQLAFGDGRCFVEKYMEHTRHIEVQCIGDGLGNVIHLFERDCSVQRRHQKIVELAPSEGVPPATRQAILKDAVRLLAAAKYRNAGTVEFLVDRDGNHYFMEVNPRVQVEHTVTEEITGIDIVQTQILIASGKSLPELGLTQDRIPEPTFCAMQCRVTTEDPAQDFRPDTGTINAFRMPAGMGIRLDDGPGFPGARISPHYDSLLVKITAKARTRKEAAAKMTRALREFRVRGVKTNKSFLLNVLQHPDFLDGVVDTGFIGANPGLMVPVREKDRASKILRYLAQVIVNGVPKSLGAAGLPPSAVDPLIPTIEPKPGQMEGRSLKKIFDEEGPESFAKAVRNRKGLLITDTTWRDAHQSLLATRIRTIDMLNVAPATNVALSNAFSLECWGGATFDVSMRFLRECPWDRLAALRKATPDIPLQMLLRGANAVGYTSYPKNVLNEFCKKAKQYGIDVFRIFDSLNYIENMKPGIEAVRQAGGVIEAALCYTGDVTDPDEQYNLDYYLEYVRQLNELGIHILAIKDMAGLLKPVAAAVLVGAIRREFPDLPIHVHTHDTAGTGVAAMLAAAKAGADVVDAAIDAMSGTTSQPSLGAIVASTARTPLDTGLDLKQIQALNEYWEECRGLYAPFESGQKTGSSDVYNHEMPGGQYSNLLYQSKQLGLAGEWSKVKAAYAAANRLLGNIIKVTPSSKVTGDLAQFLVANDLTEEEVAAKAGTLSFPNSVVEYFQGLIGLPSFGFPEPLRTNVLKAHSVASRHGTTLEPFDFEGAKDYLDKKWSNGADGGIRDVDVLSYALYSAVFDEYMAHKKKFGQLDYLDTRSFLTGMKVGDELDICIEKGKQIVVRLLSVSEPGEDGFVSVHFELNGAPRQVRVQDHSSANGKASRAKAETGVNGSIGAPMPGVVVDTRVHVGDHVKQGDPLVTLNGMKMELTIPASVEGIVKLMEVNKGDEVEPGDLIVEISAE